MDISRVSTNLELSEDGIWFSRNMNQTAYPEEGNEWFFEIESGSYWFQHRNNCIKTILGHFPPAGTVFDVGGGNGYVASAIQAMGLDVVLIEPGIRGARNAKNRGIKTVVCSTLEGTGITKHSIPAIGLFDVIEHIEDDIAFINYAKDLLVPNGKLYITVPAYNYLWSNEDVFAKHYRRYVLSDLKTKLNNQGFTVEFATYIFGFMFIPILFFRTLPSKLGIRRTIHLGQEKHEHKPPPGFIGQLLTFFISSELRMLVNKQRVLIGGSCLVSARKL